MKNGTNNMSTHKHYIPILKWKSAEQGALKKLADDKKKYMTPLIQLIMPRQKPSEQLEGVVCRFEEQVEKIPEKIKEIWGTSAIFIDFSLLYTTELKVKSIKTILSRGAHTGVHLIPVVHLGDDEAIKTTVASFVNTNKTGLCLRLVCADLDNQDEMNKRISSFLSSSGLSLSAIDILVDIKELEEDGTKYNHYLNLSQKIISISRWRNFIFASGAFPKDLTNCKLDEENLIPRLDWQNWLNTNKNGLSRKPSFSDYTAQHPIYIESTQFFHPSASIRYALKDKWWILKGQKQKYGQYLAHAKTILDDNSRFLGKNFSAGDKYIAERARHLEVYLKNPKKEKGTGNAKTWIEAGINHHVSLVVDQISSLHEK